MAHVKREFFVGKRGWMRTVRHDMSEFGDVIPQTWYKGPDTEHTLYMMMGRIKINMAGDTQTFDLRPGDRCDFPANSEYSVTAVLAMARFYCHFGPNSSLMEQLTLSAEQQAEKYDIQRGEEIEQ